jgi:hypothetical protein
MAWWRSRRSTRVELPAPHASRVTIASETGDMKAMTQGVTIRPHGLAFDETFGLGKAGAYLDAAAAGAVVDRSLHAAGQVCPRCARMFALDEPVRRLLSGEVVHDVCWLPGGSAAP